MDTQVVRARLNHSPYFFIIGMAIAILVWKHRYREIPVVNTLNVCVQRADCGNGSRGYRLMASVGKNPKVVVDRMGFRVGLNQAIDGGNGYTEGDRQNG